MIFLSSAPRFVRNPGDHRQCRIWRSFRPPFSAGCAGFRPLASRNSRNGRAKARLIRRRGQEAGQSRCLGKRPESGYNNDRITWGMVMALLIVDLDKHIGNAKAWCDTFGGRLPDLEVRIWPDAGKLADIEYLAFMHPDFDSLPVFPNLKAMFSRSAGVESFIEHPKLPKAPLCKVEPPGGDPMMTEYVVMHVLRFHRDMPGYQAAQANREWRRTTIVRPEERRVGF